MVMTLYLTSVFLFWMALSQVYIKLSPMLPKSEEEKEITPFQIYLATFILSLIYPITLLLLAFGVSKDE